MIGVGANEAGGVGGTRQNVPGFVLDRLEEAAADLGRRFDLGELHTASGARFPQGGSYFAHPLIVALCSLKALLRG